jgi:hypothetical protein
MDARGPSAKEMYRAKIVCFQRHTGSRHYSSAVIEKNRMRKRLRINGLAEADGRFYFCAVNCRCYRRCS